MFNLLQLHNMPILEQLQLEEALLRCDTNNWCIINSGSPLAIVMGISGKTEHHVNFSKFDQGKVSIPIIKRFSGGGTVIVDESTCFVSWICNKSAISLQTPKAILEWSEELYRPLFENIPFKLRENDYVIGDRKFGGNAQYIRKDRWLLHSTILWDFKPENMDYLLMPPKMPEYRAKRDHNDFICNLKEYFPKQSEFLKKLSSHFGLQLKMQEVDLDVAQKVLLQEHVKTTILV